MDPTQIFVGSSPEVVINYVRTTIDFVREAIRGVNDVHTELKKDTADEREARLLYWEVVFNLASLRAGQLATPPLLLAEHGWDRESVVSAASLASRVMDATQMPLIVGPYLLLRETQWMFQEGWTKLARPRLEGADQAALEQLRQMFLAAEEVMRGRLFTGNVAGRLAKAIDPSLTKSATSGR